MSSNPRAAPINYKTVRVELANLGVTKVFMLDPEKYIHLICEDIQEKMDGKAGGIDHGLFMVSNEHPNGIWLKGTANLDHYNLVGDETLVYKKKHRTCKVSLYGEWNTTLVIDDTATIEATIEAICARLSLANPEEFGIQVRADEVFIKEAYVATIYEESKKNIKKRVKEEKRIESLARTALKQDDSLVWLDNSRYLREAGVYDHTVLLLKKRFFFTDFAIDKNDTVGLNILYIQFKNEILSGTLPCKLEEACQLAAYMCRINIGVHSPEIHVPGFLTPTLSTYLPKEYLNDKVAEKKILSWHKKYGDITELVAKYRFVQLVRSLPNYGITFYLVKEKFTSASSSSTAAAPAPGLSPYTVPMLLGLSKDGVHRMDPITKKVESKWPLNQILKYSFRANSFEIDRGGFAEEKYIVETKHGEQINALIYGYIMFIMRKKKEINISDELTMGGAVLKTDRIVGGHAQSVRFNPGNIGKAARSRLIKQGGTQSDTTNPLAIMGGEMSKVHQLANIITDAANEDEAQIATSKNILAGKLKVADSEITRQIQDLDTIQDLPPLDDSEEALTWKSEQLRLGEAKISQSLAKISALTANLTNLATQDITSQTLMNMGVAVSGLSSAAAELSRATKMVDSLNASDADSKMLENARIVLNNVLDTINLTSPNVQEIDTRKLLANQEEIADAQIDIMKQLLKAKSPKIDESSLTPDELEALCLQKKQERTDLEISPLDPELKLILAKAKSLNELLKVSVNKAPDAESQAHLLDLSKALLTTVGKLNKHHKLLVPHLNQPECIDILLDSAKHVIRDCDGLEKISSQVISDPKVLASLKSGITNLSRATNIYIDKFSHLNAVPILNKFGPDALRLLISLDDAIDMPESDNDFLEGLVETSSADGTSLLSEGKSHGPKILTQDQITTNKLMSDPDMLNSLVTGIQTLADQLATAKASPILLSLSQKLHIKAKNFAGTPQELKDIRKIINDILLDAESEQLLSSVAEAVKRSTQNLESLKTASINAAPSNKVLASQQDLLIKSKDATTASIPALTSAKNYGQDKNNISNQLTLLATAKLVITPFSKVIVAARVAEKTVGEVNAAKLLINSTSNFQSSTSTLQSAVDKAAPVASLLELDAAITLIRESIDKIPGYINLTRLQELTPLLSDDVVGILDKESAKAELVNITQVMRASLIQLLASTLQNNFKILSVSATDAAKAALALLAAVMNNIYFMNKRSNAPSTLAHDRAHIDDNADIDTQTSTSLYNHLTDVDNTVIDFLEAIKLVCQNNSLEIIHQRASSPAKGASFYPATMTQEDKDDLLKSKAGPVNKAIQALLMSLPSQKEMFALITRLREYYSAIEEESLSQKKVPHNKNDLDQLVRDNKAAVEALKEALPLSHEDILINSDRFVNALELLCHYLENDTISIKGQIDSLEKNQSKHPQSEALDILLDKMDSNLDFIKDLLGISEALVTAARKLALDPAATQQKIDFHQNLTELNEILQELLDAQTMQEANGPVETSKLATEHQIKKLVAEITTHVQDFKSLIEMPKATYASADFTTASKDFKSTSENMLAEVDNYIQAILSDDPVAAKKAIEQLPSYLSTSHDALYQIAYLTGVSDPDSIQAKPPLIDHYALNQNSSKLINGLHAHYKTINHELVVARKRVDSPDRNSDTDVEVLGAVHKVIAQSKQENKANLAPILAQMKTALAKLEQVPSPSAQSAKDALNRHNTLLTKHIKHLDELYDQVEAQFTKEVNGADSTEDKEEFNVILNQINELNKSIAVELSDIKEYLATPEFSGEAASLSAKGASDQNEVRGLSSDVHKRAQTLISTLLAMQASSNLTESSPLIKKVQAERQNLLKAINATNAYLAENTPSVKACDASIQILSQCHSDIMKAKQTITKTGRLVIRGLGGDMESSQNLTLAQIQTATDGSSALYEHLSGTNASSAQVPNLLTEFAEAFIPMVSGVVAATSSTMGKTKQLNLLKASEVAIQQAINFVRAYKKSILNYQDQNIDACHEAKEAMYADLNELTKLIQGLSGNLGAILGIISETQALVKNNFRNATYDVRAMQNTPLATCVEQARNDASTVYDNVHLILANDPDLVISSLTEVFGMLKSTYLSVSNCLKKVCNFNLPSSTNDETESQPANAAMAPASSAALDAQHLDAAKTIGTNEGSTHELYLAQLYSHPTFKELQRPTMSLLNNFLTALNQCKSILTNPSDYVLRLECSSTVSVLQSNCDSLINALQNTLKGIRACQAAIALLDVYAQDLSNSAALASSGTFKKTSLKDEDAIFENNLKRVYPVLDGLRAQVMGINDLNRDDQDALIIAIRKFTEATADFAELIKMTATSLGDANHGQQQMILKLASKLANSSSSFLDRFAASLYDIETSGDLSKEQLDDVYNQSYHDLQSCITSLITLLEESKNPELQSEHALASVLQTVRISYRMLGLEKHLSSNGDATTTATANNNNNKDFEHVLSLSSSQKDNAPIYLINISNNMSQALSNVAKNIWSSNHQNTIQNASQTQKCIETIVRLYLYLAEKVEEMESSAPDTSKAADTKDNELDSQYIIPVRSAIEAILLSLENTFIPKSISHIKTCVKAGKLSEAELSQQQAALQNLAENLTELSTFSRSLMKNKEIADTSKAEEATIDTVYENINEQLIKHEMAADSLKMRTIDPSSPTAQFEEFVAVSGSALITASQAVYRAAIKDFKELSSIGALTADAVFAGQMDPVLSSMKTETASFSRMIDVILAPDINEQSLLDTLAAMKTSSANLAEIIKHQTAILKNGSAYDAAHKNLVKIIDEMIKGTQSSLEVKSTSKAGFGGFDTGSLEEEIAMQESILKKEREMDAAKKLLDKFRAAKNK